MHDASTPISRAGAKLIGLLVELGHLDPIHADELVLSLAESESTEGEVTLDEVRRMVATHLWDTPGLHEQNHPLARAWALLFG